MFVRMALAGVPRYLDGAVMEEGEGCVLVGEGAQGLNVEVGRVLGMASAVGRREGVGGVRRGVRRDAGRGEEGCG